MAQMRLARQTPASSVPEMHAPMPQARGIRRDHARRPPDPRRAIGRRGERLAAAHLRRLGFRTIARNHRTRHGEIDLICFDGVTLVFAEIKTLALRSGELALCPDPRPLSWLHHSQRARLRRLATAWLSAEGRIRPTAREIRFDAIGVTLDGAGRLRRIDHVENAF